MNKVNEPFKIDVNLPNLGKKNFTIYHQSETFDFNYEGIEVSILNNGDNSWSGVKGELDQEVINSIGAAIEIYYNNLEV